MAEACRLGGGMRDHDSHRWADWARFGGVHDPCACRIHAHHVTGRPVTLELRPERGTFRECLTSRTSTCLSTNGATAVRPGSCGNNRCTGAIGKTRRLPKVPEPTTSPPWSR